MAKSSRGDARRAMLDKLYLYNTHITFTQACQGKCLQFLHIDIDRSYSLMAYYSQSRPPAPRPSGKEERRDVNYGSDIGSMPSG